MRLYTKGGRRRVLPPIVFGLGVLRHLARRGSRYDVVHVASFPYFSLLAAAVMRPRRRFRLVVDWFEVWSRDYWVEYLGPVGGRVGEAVQALCLRVPQLAFCFSRLHAGRLRERGVKGEVRLLEGLYAGPREPRETAPAEELAAFAGRHIPEKRVPALVPAIAEARRQIPGLRGAILGDGPERARVLNERSRLGLEEALAVPGFVAAEEVEHTLGHALCMVLPSRREGYGLVVIEAAAQGTPSIVVRGPDNAAAELVEEGVNGTVAASAEPAELGEAIVRVHRAGPALREATADWFRRNAPRLSLEGSLETVLKVYSDSARR